MSNDTRWLSCGKLVAMILNRISISSRQFQCNIQMRAKGMPVPKVCMECRRGPCKLIKGGQGI